VSANKQSTLQLSTAPRESKAALNVHFSGVCVTSLRHSSAFHQRSVRSGTWQTLMGKIAARDFTPEQVAIMAALNLAARTDSG
jgi:hypothetical protein